MNKRKLKGIIRKLYRVSFYLLQTEIKSKKYRLLIQKELMQMNKLAGKDLKGEQEK